jgi:hypothetical protein
MQTHRQKTNLRVRLLVSSLFCPLSWWRSYRGFTVWLGVRRRGRCSVFCLLLVVWLEWYQQLLFVSYVGHRSLSSGQYTVEWSVRSSGWSWFCCFLVLLLPRQPEIPHQRSLTATMVTRGLAMNQMVMVWRTRIHNAPSHQGWAPTRFPTTSCRF